MFTERGLRKLGLAMVLFAAIVASACTDRAGAQSSLRHDAAEGPPYVLKGTQVWTVPDLHVHGRFRGGGRSRRFASTGPDRCD